MSEGMCDECGLPDEICVCTDMKKSESRTVTVTAREIKYGELTVIDGVKEEERGDVASEIKSAVGAGGSVKKKDDDDREKIYIQGDHTEREEVKDVLEEREYEVIFT